MRLLDELDRRLRRHAIPNVTIALIFGQVAVWLLSMMRLLDADRLALVPNEALHGEPWRFVSFLLLPPSASPIFIAFAWYLFYLFGTALEEYWGDLRYNVYLLIGVLATIAVSFVTPHAAATNVYLFSTVFLAFAFFNPEFELLLMFILPVKARWLALLTWAIYALKAIDGDWTTRLQILAAVSNYLVFFGPDIYWKARRAPRTMVWSARRFAEKGQTLHACVICGATERTHPHDEFLYCSQCEGAPCYCERHIRNHEHIKAQVP